VLALSVVASGVGRIASDLVSPRVFASGGMQAVTIMAALVGVVAVIIVITGVREVSPRERVRARAG
jgi:hypothetical protein